MSNLGFAYDYGHCHCPPRGLYEANRIAKIAATYGFLAANLAYQTVCKEQQVTRAESVMLADLCHKQRELMEQGVLNDQAD